jgi:leucyl aminopeptidase
MLQLRLRDGAPAASRPVALFRRTGEPVPEKLRLAAAQARFNGAENEVAELWDGARTVLLVGLGSDPNAVSCTRAGGNAAAALLTHPHAAFDARGLPPDQAAALAEGASLRAYAFTRYRTRNDADDPPPRLAALDVHVAAVKPMQAAWRAADAAVRGTLFARDLVSEPANVLTPEVFCARLQDLPGVSIEVLGPAKLRRAGMGALLGVAQGSANAPRVAVLRREGRVDARPLVLLGKGVCFDTGGISIKPAEKMEAMKADMAGAAACAGALLSLALRESPAPVVAVLGLVENAISGRAQRPGDVVRAADGSTIEIMDTDAEGRLVLADLLAWSRKTFDPVAMIDLATLTGSIVTALGHHRAGLFGSTDTIVGDLCDAGDATGERLWPMPLINGDYGDDLKSEIADIRHCLHGKLLPDACHAAAFLHRFAGDVPWAHIDIAGVEWRAEADALGPVGASGFGARLLDRLVALRYEDSRHWP